MTWPHTVPLLALLALNLLFWFRVLVTDQVLLPGEFLRGFAPFGSDPQAPWNILQWDALGQYYPWRHFAAEQLRAGNIPLWNPHQFAGTPFVANGQSAVFYPLNLPFWLFDVARAFGVSAFVHTLFTGVATYFLAQRWRLSRAASLLAAVAWSFCGYLSAWAMLPPLANTAAWLPLLIFLFEGVARRETGIDNHTLPSSAVRHALFALALCCTLLAGHAQIFFYCLVALLLRALSLRPQWHALRVLATGAVWSFLVGALQLLPTLELSRLSHRAGQTATAEGWGAIALRGVQASEWPALFIGQWPMSWGSLNENFGAIGVTTALLALCSLLWLRRSAMSEKYATPLMFAGLVALFGVACALATPLARGLYFWLPGMAQFAGLGRALLLWSFGAAILAAFGLDALRTHWKSSVVGLLGVLIVAGELFAWNWNTQPTSSRASIYPATPTTLFLLRNTRDGSRVLFITPRRAWLPSEALQPRQNHPQGVLPPNGAMVYGLNDISGYDSLALSAYRTHVAAGEEYSQSDPTLSPQLNGNMVLLNNPQSQLLDALRVRYVVSRDEQPAAVGREVLREDDCIIYQRRVSAVPRANGGDFAPGWSNNRYQPQSFRFGAFLSLCALGAVGAVVTAGRTRKHPL